ncbi:MAG: hypothetical protein FJ194_18670 [Gammaproteobacteria bacterium]|nr:hypothetical protein [Gammaproteobacteria bacterium]
MTTPRRVLPLRITLIITSFLAAFTPIAVFAAAGVTVNVEVKETGGETVQQKIHIVGQTMKMDVAGDRNGSVIFRGGTDEVITIDHDKREFMQLDRASIEKMAGAVGAATEQIGGLLEGLSPEQRAALENMLGDKMPASKPATPKRPLLRSTGLKGQHGGYETRQMEVLVDGRKRSEFWIANWQGVDARIKPALDAMSRFMKGVIDKLPASLSEPVKSGGYEVLGDLGGMPMMTREYDSAGAVVNESRVTSIQNADIDVATFNPPAGYSRRSLPL